METVERDGLADPRQSEMRRVGALLDRHSEPGDSLFGCAGEGMQRLSALDAGPENARAARIREPAETLDGDVDRSFDRPGGKRSLHLIPPWFRPLSDELGSDVQIVGRAPADLRRGPQAVYEAA